MSAPTEEKPDSAASGPATGRPTAGAGAGQDVAIAMVGEERHAIDPAIVARARRKTDLVLIPAMTIGCWFPPNP
jgi:hypothetical protein